MNGGFLFPVALQGAGTGDVEGLSSYLCRLSAAHQVPIGVLLRNCFEWHSNRFGVELGLPYLARNPGSIAQYVRPNELTRTVLMALLDASGQSNLRSATFQCLGVLDRCMKTFHRSMRWCPLCFKESEDSGLEPYFKLYWSLSAFSRCNTHGQEFQDRCPHCHALQDGFGLRLSCARCGSCGKSLAVVTSDIKPSSSWEIEAPDLHELIDQIGMEPALEFPNEGVKGVLSELVDRAWEVDQAQRLWSLIPRDECLAFVFGQTPVTLTNARRIAFRLGVQLLDLLRGTVAETPAVLDPSWTARLPKALRPVKRAPRHDRKRLCKALSAALAIPKGEQPKALKHVARAEGVTPGCLRHHFPVQSAEVLRRFAAWKASETERKQMEARAAALAYFSRRAGLEPITNKGALRVLRRKTGLPKDVLRNEIAQASQSLVAGSSTAIISDSRQGEVNGR
jgi:hypothetical protein